MSQDQGLDERVTRRLQKTSYLKCNLVIECKHSDKPWIVLAAGSGQLGTYFSFSTYSGQAAKRFIAKAHQDPTDVLEWTWFRGIETRGHTVVEAFVSAQTDRPYNAVDSVLSAKTFEVDPRICGATR